MTNQPIIESGLTFGPYPTGRCFHIEKSEIYTKIAKNVRMAEFLLLRIKEKKPSIVWIVEAKSSSPQPETKEDFDKFINEVSEKLANAFFLCWATCLGRHAQADKKLPESFRHLDLSRAEVRFILVINGHKEEWLPPIQDQLNKTLYGIIKTWAISGVPVAVLNEDLAKKHGLIKS